MIPEHSPSPPRILVPRSRTIPSGWIRDVYKREAEGGRSRDGSGGMNVARQRGGERGMSSRRGGIRGTGRVYTPGLKLKEEEEEENIAGEDGAKERKGVQLDAERNWNGAEMLS